MSALIEILLTDRTTKKNIVWATTDRCDNPIELEDVYGIYPRYDKDRQQQKLRTRERAEIFTPPEVCELQNDLVADFDGRDRQKFIDAKFLEITCGEAPYLVSRYNAVTGESIPLDKRVGLLDRKLRVIGEYNQPIGQWCPLAIRAVQSVYGYELQGDNLFLARRNVFDTVVEYFTANFNHKPPEDFLTEVAEIISWNLWQMDGLSKTCSPPFVAGANLFGGANCQIMDWTTGKPFEFQTLLKGARR